MTTNLADILEITDQVQAAIDSGEWLRARDLDVERRSLLEQFVVEQSQTDARPEWRSRLAVLEQRNNHMIGEVHHHRRRVLRDASMVRTGYAAAGSYDSAALYGEEPAKTLRDT